MKFNPGWGRGRDELCKMEQFIAKRLSYWMFSCQKEGKGSGLLHNGGGSLEGGGYNNNYIVACTCYFLGVPFFQNTELWVYILRQEEVWNHNMYEIDTMR